MIYTSYFANVKNLPRTIFPIAICGKAPDWWQGASYKKFAPKWPFFSVWKETRDNDYYINHFNKEVLNTLDIKEIIRDLEVWSQNGKFDIALICYEKPGDFCHRHLVAKWLNSIGIQCKEWEESDRKNILSEEGGPLECCEHYDIELGLCKKKTVWVSGEMPLIHCCHGMCEFFRIKEDNCRWCDSYRINFELNEDNDFHAGTIGETESHNQIMYESGNRDAPRIEFNRWGDQTNMWHTVGRYYPKYCPECGRKITEWPEVHKSNEK